MSRPHVVGRAWGRAGLVLAAVVALDQVTKALVRHGIDEGASNSVFPAVTLVHVRNKGVAFGFFSGGGWIVPALTSVALAALVAYFLLHPRRSGLWLATGLLIGGALGNVIDRIRDGAVTDFIKLPHWDAFNVADMAITIGVLTLLWVLEGPKRRHGADAPAR
ncbi:MAG: lspA [Solirubrobacterales bacterium]|nr:lspA [Solirubrobacterales bacterium]